MENAPTVIEDMTPVLSPAEQVNKASEMAKVLQKVVNQAGLARNFGGKKDHLEFEAWQTIAQFFNCSPVTEWTRPMTDDGKIIGWESRVIVVNSEGRTIAAAESMCMRDEPNWKNKPNYALRSMSQTRAAGKALRSNFAFVAVLAGYSATPSEEMDSSFNKNNYKKNRSPNGGKKQYDNNKPLAGEVTDKQKNAIYNIAKKNHGLPSEQTDHVIEWYAKSKDQEKPDRQTASELITGFDKIFDDFLEAKQKSQVA